LRVRLTRDAHARWAIPTTACLSMGSRNIWPNTNTAGKTGKAWEPRQGSGPIGLEQLVLLLEGGVERAVNVFDSTLVVAHCNIALVGMGLDGEQLARQLQRRHDVDALVRGTLGPRLQAPHGAVDQAGCGQQGLPGVGLASQRVFAVED